MILRITKLLSCRITTSWSNTGTGGRSVSNVSPAPSGTSHLAGELVWSSTSLESVVVPSENPLLRTFFSLGLQLLLERFCWPLRVWRKEWELEMKERKVWKCHLILSASSLCISLALAFSFSRSGSSVLVLKIRRIYWLNPPLQTSLSLLPGLGCSK